MSKEVKRRGPFVGLGGGMRRKASNEIDDLQNAMEEERATMQKLLKEQEEENAKKEEAIRKLGEKFARVQKGLARMEKERKISNSNKERAEKENVHLRKLLQIRDKELQSMNVKSVIGTTSIPPPPVVEGDENLDKEMNIPASIEVPAGGVSVNMSLPENHVTRMMTNLELQLSLRDEHVENLLNEVKSLKAEYRDSLAVERMLRESEGQNILLRAELDRKKKGYKEVMKALDQCFENMKVMTERYKEKEAERAEVIWEANRCMATQRATYLKNYQKLASDLKDQRAHIEELECTIASLRGDDKENNIPVSTEQLVLDNSRAIALAYKQVEHEKEIARLADQSEDRIKEAREETMERMDELNKTLLEKEELIASLKEEVSVHLDRIMTMNTEISNLQGAQLRLPPVMQPTDSSDQVFIERLQSEEKRIKDSIGEIDGSTFSEAYDSEPENEHQSVSSKGGSSKRMTMMAKKKISGTFGEDGSVSGLESATLHTFEEEDLFEKAQAYVQMERKMMEMEGEKSIMLAKLSDAGESIQRLERQVATEQAKSSLLTANIDMMEKTILEKDKTIQNLMLEINQNNIDLNEPRNFYLEVKLQTELEALKNNFRTESVIMQEMIRVLNDQVYHAMKAVESDQQKLVAGWVNFQHNIDESTDGKIAALQLDLEDLHRKSQLALQLSQAEVAALKKRLGELPPATGEGYILGLDWLLSRRKSRSPSTSPRSSPPTTPRSSNTGISYRGEVDA